MKSDFEIENAASLTLRRIVARAVLVPLCRPIIADIGRHEQPRSLRWALSASRFVTRQTPLAAAFALAAIGPAHTERLKPLQGQVIDLGDVSGVAYYTVERDGFRVVATLAKKDEDAVPVRVVAVLGPDQSLTLSTPREAGTPADAVEIIRRPDTVLVHKVAAALTN